LFILEKNDPKKIKKTMECIIAPFQNSINMKMNLFINATLFLREETEEKAKLIIMTSLSAHLTPEGRVVMIALFQTSAFYIGAAPDIIGIQYGQGG